MTRITMLRSIRNSISTSQSLLFLLIRCAILIVCALHLHLHLNQQVANAATLELAGFAQEFQCNNSTTQRDASPDIVQLRSAAHRKSSFFARSHVSESHQADSERSSGAMASNELMLQRQHQQQQQELTSSYNPDDEIQLAAAENFFYKHDYLQHAYSVSDYGLMALVARAHCMTYGDIYMHVYDTHIDQKRAASPTKVNQQLCLRQLENLVQRAELQEREKYYSKDLNLYQLLDTWGHVSSGMLVGNVYFTGMYNECRRLRISQPDGAPSAETRYCVLTAKHVDWPQVERNDLLGLKAGVCLPVACDSSMHDKRKEALLMRLVEYQLRRPEEGQVKFSRLYCLPDEDSPSRSLWQSRSSSITFVCLCLWLALLTFATYKHSKSQQKVSQASTAFGLTNVHCERFSDNDGAPDAAANRQSELSCAQEQHQQQQQQKQQQQQSKDDARSKLYRVLSIAHNARLLFDTSKQSSLMETGEKMKQSQQRNQSNQRENSINLVEEKQEFVDLRCVEGIKVIAMSYVIMGHVLMCLPLMMVNGREVGTSNSMAFFVANLVPAFAVNAFFTITGLLTGLLILKQNQSYPFITSPAKWLAFIIYRYLRIMPLYALIVLYCKTLARFTGAGPLWDYGTSSLSQRRACEHEPWDVTLMFKSNLVPPLQHCIPGGWYLSNDFQFFLVTPLFLGLLHKRPQLGKRILVGSIIAGYLAGFYSIYSSKVNDLRPIANFAPHGFKTYVSHFSFNYTRPQYRIPAYLIGLLMGHQLFLYEAAKRAARVAKAHKIKERQLDKTRRQLDENGNEINQDGGAEPGASTTTEPDWSHGFKRNGTLVCSLLVLICCITPVIGAQLPFNLESARFMVAFITPSYHVLFSLAVGLYLLLATTGNGNTLINRWLAKPFWKPLARLSLCAVLVNVEVINYFMQTNTSQHYVSNQYHVTLNCLCIATTYAVSTLVCVLFEAPIRGALNGLLTMAITKVAAASSAGKIQAKQNSVPPATATSGGGQSEKVKTC